MYMGLFEIIRQKWQGLTLWKVIQCSEGKKMIFESIFQWFSSETTVFSLCIYYIKGES